MQPYLSLQCHLTHVVVHDLVSMTIARPKRVPPGKRTCLWWKRSAYHACSTAHCSLPDMHKLNHVLDIILTSMSLNQTSVLIITWCVCHVFKLSYNTHPEGVYICCYRYKHQTLPASDQFALCLNSWPAAQQSAHLEQYNRLQHISFSSRLSNL